MSIDREEEEHLNNRWSDTTSGTREGVRDVHIRLQPGLSGTVLLEPGQRAILDSEGPFFIRYVHVGDMVHTLDGSQETTQEGAIVDIDDLFFLD